MFTSASPPSKERDPRRAARPPVCTINGNHFLFSSNADAEKSVVRRWHAPPASADIRDCISIRKWKELRQQIVLFWGYKACIEAVEIKKWRINVCQAIRVTAQWSNVNALLAAHLPAHIYVNIKMYQAVRPSLLNISWFTKKRKINLPQIQQLL